MYVPGTIKRVLKKANLNKQKSVAEHDASKKSVVNSWMLDEKTRLIQYDDGSTSQYEVEQLYTGVLQSSVDDAEKNNPDFGFLVDPEELKPDFVDITEDEFDALNKLNAVAHYTTKDKPEDVVSIEEANIVTSLVEGREKIHAAVIDLDFPHVYVPSSTPGHGHLYIDQEWDEEKFFTFLEILVDFGLVEPGYYKASKARGYSAVRLPHIKKEVSGG